VRLKSSNTSAGDPWTWIIRQGENVGKPGTFQGRPSWRQEHRARMESNSSLLLWNVLCVCVVLCRGVLFELSSSFTSYNHLYSHFIKKLEARELKWFSEGQTAKNEQSQNLTSVVWLQALVPTYFTVAWKVGPSMVLYTSALMLWTNRMGTMAALLAPRGCCRISYWSSVVAWVDSGLPHVFIEMRCYIIHKLKFPSTLWDSFQLDSMANWSLKGWLSNWITYAVTSSSDTAWGEGVPE
jgi:hypothetical protein